MKRKVLVLLSMILSSIILLTGCGTSNPSNNDTSNNGSNTQKETFTIAMEAGYPPFNWTQMDDSNGGIKIEDAKEFAGGYDLEIAKRIAEGLGKELRVGRPCTCTCFR